MEITRSATERSRGLGIAVPNRLFWPISGATALLAVAVRAVPLFRGGGLYGLGNYDDGVYYAAGTALLHGVLPYRDYLFLQPPGITIVLAPFGLAGLLGHDPSGLAAARVAWVLLGAVNTLLVARILRPVGLTASVAGGLFYATAYPAIYTEWTTLLEGPAQTCLLTAVLLVETDRSGRRQHWLWLAAGALLGLSATFKIWGVVAVATVVAWSLITRRSRRAGWVAAGAAGGITAVCLPFFAAAPIRMWQMVVIDQLGRPRSSKGVGRRLADILGLGLHRTQADRFALAMITAAAVIGLVAVAATVAQARLSVVLTLTLTATLLASPSWFTHYPALATGPLAVAVGAGAAVALHVLARWNVVAWCAGALLLVGLLFVDIRPLAGLRLGRPFPQAALAASASDLSGCVSSDDPTALVELNVLTRNLTAGCRFVADIGGYSYQLDASRGRWLPRSHDARWQQIYLDQLSWARWTLAFRYAGDGALSHATLRTIHRWPVEHRIGRYAIRATG
jgi:alpha-1,2-mannosyltransferase